MAKVVGQAEIEVTMLSGEVEQIEIDGSEFGLEEGGDWSVDREHNVIYTHFLFIAFCEGFELHLKLAVYGQNNETYDPLEIIPGNLEELEELEIKQIKIIHEDLKIKYDFPSDVSDID